MLRTDTICALATPAGMGAIAMIRISGNDAFKTIDSVFRPVKKGVTVQNSLSHTALFGTIEDNGELIDEVLVTVFKNPKSFTGEDSVEISCHGSVYIQQQIIQLLLKNGVRMADPGEFTMRAYMNGKMDLSQAEAVADIIESESATAHKVAMNQMRGGFSKELQQLRTQLIDFASLVELELDFAEEDVEFANRDQLADLMNTIQNHIQKLIQSFAMGNAIKNGIPVAIVGAPNAGKSTLLNALLREERALVSEIAGTTRDTVEDEVHLGGVTFRFIDTAGLRDTEDVVESMGIERAYQKIEQARLVIFLFDAAVAKDPYSEYQNILAKAGDKPVLVISNKSDKSNAKDFSAEFNKVDNYLKLSAKNAEGIEELENALIKATGVHQINNNETIVTNARHLHALTQAGENLARAQQGLEMDLPGDLMAQDIRQTLFHLGEITGEVSADDLLGNIFGKFCIGK
ncbi:MAG: tRNA uridine-5-carboxymethylaminomethyl(34) synthesis GTPase MnmE [Schleiferiaceae bacterium]|nr:tRNA uridine-5-carboxymethylaminomethyl(34) synthesis GTPase MnmE [Schleiferiaceae bacterium]